MRHLLINTQRHAERRCTLPLPAEPTSCCLLVGNIEQRPDALLKKQKPFTLAKHGSRSYIKSNMVTNNQ